MAPIRVAVTVSLSKWRLVPVKLEIRLALHIVHQLTAHAMYELYHQKSNIGARFP